MSPETDATEVLRRSFCHCLVGDKRIRRGLTESTASAVSISLLHFEFEEFLLYEIYC